MITISGRGNLELPASASALTALETCHRMPRERTTDRPENQQVVRPENSAKQMMMPRSSLTVVNITSNLNLLDSCWIDNPQVPPIARCSSDRSLAVLVLYLERPARKSAETL